MTLSKFFSLGILMFIVAIVDAQTKKRLNPGKMYSSGDTIYAPRYGFTSTVPQGWEGVLPRDLELFLLLPDTIVMGGEVYTFTSVDSNVHAIRNKWMKGVSLSESIAIKANSEVLNETGIIFSEVVASGQNVNTGNKGYAGARCSPYGPCITSLAIGPAQCYQDMKQAVEYFIRSATFSAPSDISVYADFNWKEFLSNKMLIAFMAAQGELGSGQKDNTIHLCSDGSFQATVSKKGAMKQFNPDYRGQLSGTWVAEGIGEHGVLKLNFKKLPSVAVPLTIKDEKDLCKR